jgi:hypothetical protein
MKILDIPQSGKRGVTVSQHGHNGQISRALVIPTNPQTDAQMRIRGFLRSVASKWRGLTPEQRAAWMAEALQHQSKARTGQSGTLSGFQLYTKINCSLLVIGGTVVLDPPAMPEFNPLPVTGLVITNTGGVVTLKLTSTDAPPDGTMLWGAAPCSQGQNVSRHQVFLGTLDSPVNNAIDISTAYKGRYGSPAAGKKVFLRVRQNIHGWEDFPSQFSAIVPAAS